MRVAIQAFSFVGMFDRALVASDRLISKGAAFANDKGVAEDEFLNWNLIEGMAPFGFQIRVVRDFAVQWPARFCGIDIPEDVSEAQTQLD